MPETAESVPLLLDLFAKVVYTLLAVGVAWAANRLAQWLIGMPLHSALGSKISNRARIETVESLVSSIIKYAVFIAAFLMILSGVWKVDTSSLVVGTAVLGAAIGFGSQHLVQDIVTGLSLLLETKLDVGMHVQIAGRKGKVLEVGLRSVKLKGDDGHIHLIFNRTISCVTILNQDNSPT